MRDPIHCFPMFLARYLDFCRFTPCSTVAAAYAHARTIWHACKAHVYASACAHTHINTCGEGERERRGRERYLWNAQPQSSRTLSEICCFLHMQVATQFSVGSACRFVNLKNSRLPPNSFQLVEEARRKYILPHCL